MARITGTRFSAIGFCWKGDYTRRARAKGAREFLISCAGPLVNVVLAAILWNDGGIITWLGQMNAILALVNLLPFGESDGQRILALVREWLTRPCSSEGS